MLGRAGRAWKVLLACACALAATGAMAAPTGCTAANSLSFSLLQPVNAPMVTGCASAAVITYTVAPSLPPGLSLGVSTGVVTGTPTRITAAAGYTVTATAGGTSSSVSVSLGVACPPASYCASPTTATACAQGAYCPPGATASTLCAAGYYCSTPASQVACTASGAYCPAGSVAAQECPAGSYCSSPAAAPVACSAGTYCPAGTQTALQCPAGSFCPASAVRATPCAEGYFSLAGAGACTACPAGSFAADEGSAACSLCPANTYNPHTGFPLCAPCPGDDVSPRGSVSAEACHAPAFIHSRAGPPVVAVVIVVGLFLVLLLAQAAVVSGAGASWARTAGLGVPAEVRTRLRLALGTVHDARAAKFVPFVAGLVVSLAAADADARVVAPRFDGSALDEPAADALERDMRAVLLRLSPAQREALVDKVVACVRAVTHFAGPCESTAASTTAASYSDAADAPAVVLSRAGLLGSGVPNPFACGGLAVWRFDGAAYAAIPAGREVTLPERAVAVAALADVADAAAAGAGAGAGGDDDGACKPAHEQQSARPQHRPDDGAAGLTAAIKHLAASDEV